MRKVGITVSSGIQTALVSTASGAVFGAVGGGVYGGVDAALGGGDWRSGALQGAIAGFILGAAGGALAGQWSLLTNAAHLTLKIAALGFNVASTGAGLIESWFNGEYDQMGFRLFAGLGGFSLLRRIPTCFPAGTKVLVADSADEPSAASASIRFRNIETVRPGEVVLAYDTTRNEYEMGRVVEVHARRSRRLQRLTILDSSSQHQVLRPTPEHPFWIEDRGWTPAIAVRLGDIVRLANGTSGTIVASEPEELSEEITVYNFEVADYHNYFVAGDEGCSGVLVHNANYLSLLSGLRTAVRSGTKFDAHADSLDDALNAVKQALGADALELPPGMSGCPYIDPPKGTKKWFRIEPPDGTSEFNSMFHIKISDFTGGKRGRGGTSGHITFPEADYWKFLELLTNPNS